MPRPKNHDFVTVVCDPADYSDVLAELAEGDVTTGTRRRLAGKVFARTAAYDRAIAGWLSGDAFGETMTVSGRRSGTALWREPASAGRRIRRRRSTAGVATATQLQGKPLSYNNLNDTDAAFELAAEFTDPTIAIIKHANPCGVASAADLGTPRQNALSPEPGSAFGGIVAANMTLDAETARAITGIFTEVVIAPDADDEARAILAEKPNLRLLVTGSMPDPAAAAVKLKSVSGGFLAQSRDNGSITAADLRIVTKAARCRSDRRHDVRLACLQACEIERHRLCQRPLHRRCRRRPDEPCRFCSFAAQKARDTAAHHGWDAPRTIGSVAASDAFSLCRRACRAD